MKTLQDFGIVLSSRVGGLRFVCRSFAATIMSVIQTHFILKSQSDEGPFPSASHLIGLRNSPVCQRLELGGGRSCEDAAEETKTTDKLKNHTRCCVSEK